MAGPHAPGLPATGQDSTPGCVAVAYSGGRDSLALLHATCHSALALGLRVVALHVHHGLLPEADDWQRQARALVARWRRRGLPLTLQTCRLCGQPAAGDSVEAWARQGRHAALARMAHAAGAGLLLLAQHRRDQAETVLLQLLRGGGPAGLAAMPALAKRDGMLWARPWLDQPREAVEAYVLRHRLRPVEDPSNAELRWARNRLRLQVWPALTAAFADTETALAAAARRAAEADQALAELAALDLLTCTDGQAQLQVSAWSSLSPARRANALRAWWRRASGRGLPETLLQRLLRELPGAKGGRWPPVAGRQAVVYRGVLRLRAAHPCGVGVCGVDVGGAAGAAAAEPGPSSTKLGPELHPPERPHDVRLDLSRPGRWPVPAWGGAWRVWACDAGGIAQADLRAVSLRPRGGGERFQRAPATPARALKKQYQALGVPPLERGGPLLWQGERLLYVPGLGMDARALASAGAPQCALAWQAGADTGADG